MKKMLTALLAFLLLLSLTGGALAAGVTGLTGPVDELMGGGLVRMWDATGVWLVDATGTACTPVYHTISDDDDGLCLAKFTTSAEVGHTGLLNTATGEELLPAVYGLVDLLGPNWIVAVAIEPSDSPAAPYYDAEGNRYAPVRSDVFYRGELVTSLSPKETGAFEVTGDFLCIITDTNVLWVAATGEKQVYQRYAKYRDEFSEDYHTGAYLHNGSGQEVYVPTCTLTAEQVTAPCTQTEAGLVDLQGNLIAPAETLPEDVEVIGCINGYMCLQIYDRTVRDWVYALMKTDGTLVVPFVMTNLPQANWFAGDAMPVVTTDGRLCYLDATGAVLSSVTLPEGMNAGGINGLDEGAPVLYYTCDGVVTVLTADGVLDVTGYDQVRDVWNGERSHGLLSVQQNGLWGCINEHGDLVVPCVFAGQPEISFDGGAVLGTCYNDAGDEVWRLYTLDK